MDNIFKPDISNPTEPRRKLVVLGLLIVAVFVLLFLVVKFIGTGRINLSLTNNKEPLTVEIFKQSNGERVASEKVQAGTFNKFLPAGAYEIRVFSADNQAVSYLASVPRFFRTTTKTAVMQNQAERQKMARDVSSCPVLAGEQLYSFTCGWSNVISRHTPLTAEKYSARQDFPVGGVVAAKSYRDGMLALRILSGQPGLAITPVVSFIKNGVVVSSKTLPASFASTGSDNNPDYQLVIDRKNHDGFVVVKKAASAEIASFKSLESDPVTRKVEFPGLSLGSLASSTDLYDDRFLIAVGKSGNPVHEPAAKKDAKPLPTIVRIFNIKSQSTESADYEIKEPFNKASFCGTEDVCILRDNKLTVYKKSAGKLIKRGSINQVDSFLELNNTSAAYLQNKKIYKLNVDDLSATALYASDHFSVTDIFASENAIVMNAGLPSATNQEITHTFLLGLNPAERKDFVDDKLPYGKDRYIWDMDYSGKTILTTLILNSSTFDRATSTIGYDQTEYAGAVKQLTERLAKDGFSSPEYTIRFIVSY